MTRLLERKILSTSSGKSLEYKRATLRGAHIPSIDKEGWDTLTQESGRGDGGDSERWDRIVLRFTKSVSMRLNRRVEPSMVWYTEMPTNKHQYFRRKTLGYTTPTSNLGCTNIRGARATRADNNSV